MSQISFSGLAHAYGNNPQSEDDYALKQIDHQWDDGGAYALLGPSGCGKSTLLNIISGLLHPSEGKVLFGDQDVTELSTEQRNIAQVFQFPVVYDTMSVYDNLAFPLRNRGWQEDKVDQRVREVADMLDMGERLKQRARGLTADAKQIISLGRGLVRPDVAAILFDEPLTVIDPHLKWQLRSKLKHLHKQLAMTMIYVTHDQVEALTFADKVVVMTEGKVVQMGTPQELFERPGHTFVGYFIGSPGMNVLPASVDGNVALVHGQSIAINGRYADNTGQIELGIRPEFCELNKEGKGLAVEVTAIEDLGRYRIARAQSHGDLINVMVREGQSCETGSAHVTFAPEHVHMYRDGWRMESER